MTTQEERNTLLVGTLVTALYIATGLIGLSVAYQQGSATLLFPPSGIALSAMLLKGRENMSPFIWVGSFALNVQHGSPAWLAAVIACGSTAQAFMCSTLISMEQIKQGRWIAFAISALMGCVTAATVGVTGLWVAHHVPFVPTWLSWYVGDVFGILSVTPVVVMLFHPEPVRLRGSKIFLGCFAMLLIGLIWATEIQHRQLEIIWCLLLISTSSLVGLCHQIFVGTPK